MKVLVCGGRDFNDKGFAYWTLDYIHAKKPISQVIHGAYRGANLIADDWSKANHVLSSPFPADWERYQNRAGPVRNRQMLREGKPDLVVAFKGGAGTRDMMKASTEAGIKVLHTEKYRQLYLG